MVKYINSKPLYISKEWNQKKKKKVYMRKESININRDDKTKWREKKREEKQGIIN